MTLENLSRSSPRRASTGSHLETVFITNMQSAYGRGILDQGMDSDISGELWGWRYQYRSVTIALREEHEELQGSIFAKGEGEEVPPWDYNCVGDGRMDYRTRRRRRKAMRATGVPPSARERMGETESSSPALHEEHEPELGD